LKSSESEQRQHLRFPPAEWEIALIQCSDAPVDELNFDPQIAALVLEESRAGCGLVALDRQIQARLKIGDRCLVKVARLGIMLAEVKWIQPVAEGISRLGLEYRD